MLGPGDRVKAVGGHTDLLAIFAQGGNYGDTGGETAQCIAEVQSLLFFIRHSFLLKFFIEVLILGYR